MNGWRNCNGKVRNNGEKKSKKREGNSWKKGNCKVRKKKSKNNGKIKG